MIHKAKSNTIKIIAGLMAVLMLVNVVPIGVFATGVTDDSDEESPTCKVSFDVGTNGEVEYNTSEIAEGGKVTAVFMEENGTVDFRAVANSSDGYHVEKVSIGDEVQFENGSNADTTWEGTVPVGDEDITGTVEFAINKYSVTVSTDANGSVSPVDSSYEWGSDVTIQIKPNHGYEIDTFTVNDADQKSDLQEEIFREKYSYKIENIQEDQTIEVGYVKTGEAAYEDAVDKIIIYDKGGQEYEPVVDGRKFILPAGGYAALSPKAPYVRLVINSDPGIDASKIDKSLDISGISVDTDEKWGGWKDVDLADDPVRIVIDDTAPVIEDIVKVPDKDFNNGSYTVTMKVLDDHAGVDRVYYSTENDISGADVAAYDKETGTASFQTREDEYNNKYYIWAVDRVGNMTASSESIDIKIDKTAPVIKRFDFSSPVLNAYEYGTFSNTDIKVVITASDTESGVANSGVSSITFNGKTESVDEEGKAEFSLAAADFAEKKLISAIATDKAGNTCGPVMPEAVNSNIKSAYVVISDTKPEIHISQLQNADYVSGTENWYSGNTDFAVNVSDKFGIKSVIIKMNGKEVVNESFDTTIQPVSSKEYRINTETNPLEGKNTITVDVVNVTENHSEDKKSDVYIDKTLPCITDIVKVPDKDFNNGSYTVTMKVLDDYTGVDRVYYSTENDISGADVAAYDKETGTASFQTREDEYNNKYYIWAVDRVGNTASESIDIKIDKTAPVIKRFDFSSPVLNAYEYGTFSNTDIKVVITASDIESGVANSGVSSITFNGKTESVDEEGKAEFSLAAADFAEKKLISAIATDKAGNTCGPVMPQALNSNIKSAYVVISDTKPEIHISQLQNADYVSGTENWYAGNTEFAVNVSDKFGIKSVIIKMNGKEVVNESFDTALQPVSSKEYRINTETNPLEGKNTITVDVVNVTGNHSEDKKSDVYIDTVAPYITGFDFEAADFVEGSETASSVEATGYGFYFKKDTNVTISAEDDAPTAGLKSITYYTIDKDTGKSDEKTVQVNSDGKIRFLVKADFKGQIYAKAADNVQNTTDRFVNPNSVIIERTVKHRQEKHIEFTKGETEYKTKDNTELYSKDVPVTITVMDTYSGIREVEWSVTAPYDTENNQNGKVIVNNDKTVTVQKGKGWKKTRTESNIVTEMTKTIVVNNNSNNIIVKVKMTDRAGNTSEEEMELSIDKTDPVIKVEYDNNDADEAYSDFFKADRTATVTVTERNFRGKDVVYEITNTTGAVPSLSAWREHKNTENPDATYYTATVSYTTDGDYTFDIHYADLAGNNANKVKQHVFTLDKTIPTVSVTYDNNAAIEGNYFKDDRTATITVVEHNFDASRVKIIGKASDNGDAVAFPAISSWASDGDTHVATIDYSEDARYSFDIEFLDKAGNSIERYSEENFYVDKTAPVLEISGVRNKSANRGIVAPVVTCTDTNFDKDEVSITLRGINNGEVKYNGSYEDIANGQRFTYADFEKTRNVDDIYKLTATMTDKAGNKTTETILFSVNRFGSTYTFSSETQELNGNYVKNPIDVVVHETNADELSDIRLTLFKNNEETTLNENSDYRVDVEGGKGQWHVYTYSIFAKNFADDGVYKIQVSSKDAAGNIAENVLDTKNAEIEFVVDDTAPTVVVANLESGKTYSYEDYEVIMSSKDNIRLASVKVNLDGEEYESWTGEKLDQLLSANGEFRFHIPGDSIHAHKLTIVSTDAAQNEIVEEIEDFFITTNLAVRYYNNKPLFFGSIAGVVVLTGLILFFVFKKRKRKLASSN